MSDSDVTRDGIEGVRPGREATVGVNAGRPPATQRRRGRGEQPMVPDATFVSYYGLPVLNKPVWEAPDIPGYLYLGGLAGAGSALAAAADLTGRPALARAMKVGATGAIAGGLLGLVHDLGRPARFVNMLRTFKPTSPMSVGSWLLSGYAPAAALAAGSAVTGRLPMVGRLATGAAAGLGPLVASYTAALITNTAVPAWHDGYREMPFVFVGSAATAAGGLGMVAAPPAEATPARRLAALGAVLELAASRLLEHRVGEVAGPYHSGTSGKLMRTAETMTALGGLGGLLVGRRHPAAATACGAVLLTASALTRFAIFSAGVTSAETPAHTVGPQRERLRAGRPARSPATWAPAAGRAVPPGGAVAPGRAVAPGGTAARDGVTTPDVRAEGTS